MHAKDHVFLRTASSSAVEFLLETILCMKWCEQRGMMGDWQLVVMPLIFHLGHIGEKNSSLVIGECFRSFSQKHSSCLRVLFLFVFKNGIFKIGIVVFCKSICSKN